MWGMNEEGERKGEPGDCPLVTTLPLAAARRRGYTKKRPKMRCPGLDLFSTP